MNKKTRMYMFFAVGFYLLVMGLYVTFVTKIFSEQVRIMRSIQNRPQATQ